MMKKWQNYCNVPLKSFWLERLAEEFIANWSYRGKSSVYYDWMVRDFFSWLKGQANTYIFLPITYEAISLGDAWKSRAESAYERARKACDHEAANKNVDAWWEWKNIFGDDVPLN
ncbi:hypothetical protein [Terriglobus sp. TAA 43]|uniref:hypothetical protein n=1 Tax=Terriglobus sp. TAA 43 TaxID=278961 RepID=UPI0012ED43C3|nr:hypothetical protein [Terriglobus sp. TAA 43]